MLVYLIKRVNLLVTTLFLLSLMSFSLGHLFPGDSVINFTGQQSLTYEEYAQLRQDLALDESYFMQYVVYLERVFAGDFGLSFSSQSEVLRDFMRVFPASAELSFYALLVTCLIGIPLGLWAGIKRNTLVDKVIFSISAIANSIPIFWLGLLFILLFSLNLAWLPISGRLNLLYDIPYETGILLVDIALSDFDNKWPIYHDALRHLILPTLTLATLPTTLLIGMMRSNVISVMNSQYIKAARTKGLSLYQIIRRHVLRNALLPIIPQFGLLFNTLMTSTMITEIIFSWPGIGHWLLEAIYQRDYPVIQASLLLVSSFMIFINVLSDVCHTMVNPLVRKEING
ncbi:peptide ABC transporter [Catenovulum agarivorans DS-2]|uniref:Peptide ABC transporter n=1 Tax=Catenovulum agarivorans DS-2 TaxID=1328313 RepID=W7QS59_9ALTE|nr:ABC transporter permease [Catenovulum agarivorans]EWH11852.1 peptide ABC transporter [Catenovulum agarivorans DS-2]